MARKIGKNSRNARQAAGLYDDPEVESLKDLPRAQKTDLSNIMIRTAAKNEALLDAKIKKKRNDKKKLGKKSLEEKLSKSVTHMDKERLTRALNISNKLDGKISKAIARAKYVQSSRKAGWDTTNEIIKRELQLFNGEFNNKNQGKKKVINSEEVMEEDDNENEEIEKPFIDEDSENEQNKKKVPTNIFSVLENEVED